MIREQTVPPVLPTFGEDFDAVLMLTWSDWKTEPRSNRYHYGSRFAKIAPVLFIQPGLQAGAPIRTESSGVPGLDIVSVPDLMTPADVDAILELLNRRGIHKPLLWMYSAFHYWPLLRALPQAFRVYHATEDYLTPSEQWASQDAVAAALKALLKETDMVVGVSEKVNRVYAELGGFDGPMVLSPNGCDAPFFQAIAAGSKVRPAARTCIFQGGINARVDYDLLLELVDRMPDWTFWFCGRVVEGLAGWTSLRKRPNVQYLGCLAPEEFGQKMAEATVGIIPFVQEDMIWNSLPLKAYEYVACGLPVVTVPIAALADRPRLFAIETTAEGFARSIEAAAATRLDPEALALRAEEARRNSYDGRFAAVVGEIRRVVARRRLQPKRLNVCVLYDQNSVRVNTIKEHLDAFTRYSRHEVFYMPATDHGQAGFNVLSSPWSHLSHVRPAGAWNAGAATGPDLSFFDVVIVHFCVRVCVDGHMVEAVERAMTRFQGLKVLFIQDEYDTPEVARRWMERVGINLVYTCVPPAEVDKLYPRARFPWVEFRPTLTGYVPEDASIDDYALPLDQRPNLIAYRGRKLPPIYGELGWEKYVIGREVKRLAQERGLTVDVEVDDSKRIYGKGWYRFLGSARATLGTESGCNLFDFDGTAAAMIKARQAKDPAADYGSMREELAPYEGVIHMNQISPKIFESIRTRTALVLFEGSYSGAVRPHEHFIPLRKDFSNFDEVIRYLQDDDKVRDLTHRAYRDIIESGRYSYASFIQGVDADVERSLVRGARVRLFSFPLLALTADGLVEQVGAEQASGAMLAGSLVDNEAVREVLRQHAEGIVRRMLPAERIIQREVTQTKDGETRIVYITIPDSDLPPRRSWARQLVRRGWSLLPAPVRARISSAIRSLARRHNRPELEKSGIDRTLTALWRRLPDPAKRAARRVIYRR